MNVKISILCKCEAISDPILSNPLFVIPLHLKKDYYYFLTGKLENITYNYFTSNYIENWYKIHFS